MKISEKHGMHLDLAQKWLQLHGCETSAYYFLCWTSFCWRTQTTNYFSSKKKKNFDLWSATMVIHMQVLTQQEEEDTFKEGKGSWEDCSKQGVHGFSLAESWPSLIGWALARQEEEVFLLVVGLCYCPRA